MRNVILYLNLVEATPFPSGTVVVHVYRPQHT